MIFRALLFAMSAALIWDLPTARADMADDCVQSADLDLSIGGCTAAIRSGRWSGKDLAPAYYNRGNAYSDLGQHQRAIADYDQALRLDSGYVDAYYNRGVAYRKLGQHQRAIADYDQALRLDPGNADAYHNRGVAYEDLGQLDQAVRDWERAIDIQGTSRIRWWQEWTRKKGHYRGAIDGIYGPGTRAALMVCARDPEC